MKRHLKFLVFPALICSLFITLAIVLPPKLEPLNLTKTQQALGIRTNYFGEAVYKVGWYYDGPFVARGTAFAVQTTEAGTIMVTAAHVAGSFGVEMQYAKQGRILSLQSVAFPEKAIPNGVVLASSLGGSDATVFLVPGFRSRTLELSTSPIFIGDEVTSIGAVPLGLTISVGYVGKLIPEPGLDFPAPVIMHSANTYPGCSGGPVLNADGEVVGLNTCGWFRERIGGMTPVRFIRQALDQVVLR